MASAVTFAGAMTAGAVVSRTVTVKEPWALLPAASVTEQSTVVVPSGNVEPEAGTHVTATEPSTKSLAEALKVAVAPPGPVASNRLSKGSVRLGGVVSTTVTVNVAVPVLPAPSVAEQVTDVGPRAKVEPDAGEQDGVSDPLTASEADAPE